MSASTKVIVTNEGALSEKYGAPARARIRAAIDKLAASDKARGISTCVVALDSAADTRTAGVLAPLRSVTDERGTKRAIDTIFRKLRPDYLLIVGASDVVTYQTLSNPVRDQSANGDTDETINSDLPYACEATYSVDPKDFVEPSRVVGRIPDLEHWKNPAYLLSRLAEATAAIPRAASDHAKHFGVGVASAFVAAECDCGARQHDAADAAVRTDIPNGALRGASTTTGYTSPDAIGSADLMCQYFLQEVFGGASIGRAMLEARQHFVATSQPLDGIDLKTLAQFVVLGDPSFQAVAQPARRPRERKPRSLPPVEAARISVRAR